MMLHSFLLHEKRKLDKKGETKTEKKNYNNNNENIVKTYIFSIFFVKFLQKPLFFIKSFIIVVYSSGNEKNENKILDFLWLTVTYKSFLHITTSTCIKEEKIGLFYYY